MNKVFLLFLLICFSSIHAQQDVNGWTILDPDKADKVIYVSSSSGNDSNGKVYTLPSSNVGDNPILPTNNIKPFKSVEAAVSSIENGEAVWVLLKRGDVFYSGLTTRSGKSEDQPFLYSSYGNSSEPPLLKTGAESGVSHCCRTLENFWIVGLSFYAHTRDPDSQEYVGDAGSRGIYLEAHKGHRLRNVLLEGNVVRYYKDNVIQSFTGTGIVKNITLRRNMILDGYNNSTAENESIGLFVQNVDGFLLEENIFDHNGWLIPSYGNSEASDRTNGQATKYSHSTYFVDTQNVIFRNNSFNRPSTMATKWLATDTGSSENITVSNNLFNDCEIGVSMGTNYREGSYRYKNMNVRDNVMVDQGLSNPTKRNLSWGIEIDDWDGGNFSDNILTSQNASTKSGFGIGISGETRDVTIAGNIIYDLKDRRGILISHSGTYGNIEFNRNELTYFTNFERFVRVEKNSFQGLSFEENTYTNAKNYRNSFYVFDRDYQFNEWTKLHPQEKASIELPDYPDATRNLDRYITEVLGLASRQAYYRELRKLTKHNWQEAYSGGAIVKWIRNGFRIDIELDTESPVPDDGDLPDVIGECSVLEITKPTATDAVSGNIQGKANLSFPISENSTIIWYYTDEAGNTSSQQQRVIVKDTEEPVIDKQNLSELTAACSMLITDIPIANDNCDGVIQGLPNVDLEEVLSQSTTIIWTYTDSAGNSTTQSQEVIITETDELVANVQNLPEINGECSVMITDIPTATLGCNDIILGISNINLGEPITETTNIIWSYIDDNGNSISQQQKIVVEDVTAPIPDDVSLPDLQGICAIDRIVSPTAFDGCDGVITGTSNVQFPIINQDINEIVWTYIDANNNSITQIQKVSLSVTDECILNEIEIGDFEIQTSRETCLDKNDAQITVKTSKPFDFTAKVINSIGYEETFSFNKLFNLNNLSPGQYTICFIAADGDFEICQTIVAPSAEELMVDVQVEEENKKALLSLSGSDQYIIILNGVSNTIEENEISLDLKTGVNELEVYTENECPESFMTSIVISDLAGSSKKLMVYPNPVRNGALVVSIKDLDYVPFQFNLVTISGKVIKTFDDFNSDQEEVVIDVSDLVQGTYIIQGVLIDRIYTARFIKI